MRVVLVRPRDPNNIGAAARAMANFGLSDLVLVAPYDPVWREARSAVGAGDLLAAARVVDRLEEAIAECTLVGATTAGTRRRLARVVSPEAFVAEAREGDAHACLVFGNEKHGLSAGEIARCHVAVRIATASNQPSMNLGQAVAVCCYEVSRGRDLVPRAPAPRGERAATAAEVEALVEAAVPDPATAPRAAAARDRLRTLLLRGRATAPEVSLLRGLLNAPSDNDPDGASE